jgi:signal transduction histidine kinase
MAFAAWATAQVSGLLARLSNSQSVDVLENGAVQAQVAVLYRSCTQHTSQELRTPAAARRLRADLEATGMMDALAEAATSQLR